MFFSRNETDLHLLFAGISNETGALNERKYVLFFHSIPHGACL